MTLDTSAFNALSRAEKAQIATLKTLCANMGIDAVKVDRAFGLIPAAMEEPGLETPAAGAPRPGEPVSAPQHALLLNLYEKLMQPDALASAPQQ